MALIWVAIKLREHLEENDYVIPGRDLTEKMISSTLSFCWTVWKSGWMSTTIFTLVVLLCAYAVGEQWLGEGRKLNRGPFPFMKLPPELRAEVFKNLLDPPEEPTEAPEQKYLLSNVKICILKVSGEITGHLSNHSTHIINALSGNATKRLTDLMGINWDAITKRIERFKQDRRLMQNPNYKHLTNMRLVSRQFGAEFLSTYLTHAHPVFTIDASSPSLDNPFGISNNSLLLVGKCTLRMIAKPGIVHAFDPREASARDWALRDSVFDAMKQMKALRNMTLTIAASGGQLWNPVWLWHFTAQAFKESDVKAFNRIEFSMMEWNVRSPHHLVRCADGWEWHCEDGHSVMKDKKVQDVRAFASSLFASCRECKRLHNDLHGVHDQSEDSGSDDDDNDDEE